MGNCFIRHRGGKKKLKTRSLYSFCTNINESGTYSETISGIKYDIECVTVPEVTDDNVDTIFSSISSNEGYFLLLKTNYINISKTLTPPYPKKSLIIFCSTVEGTGIISMTGKGPNCLPEDILLFEEKEVKEVGRVLIPAYANNAKDINRRPGDKTIVTANNGTGYNCGSGGVGGVTRNNSYDTCGVSRMRSGSGYSYGGGAGTSGTWADGNNAIVDSTYPMRANTTPTYSYYQNQGGVGNPPSKNYGGADEYNNKGVGGRLILFCNNIYNINLKCNGVDSKSTSTYWAATAGGSGAGSINLFYKTNDTSIKECIGGKGGAGTNSNNPASQGYKGFYGINGGNGTVVNIKCKHILI